MESSSISNLGSCGSTTTSGKEKGKKKEGGGAVKLSTDPQSVAARLRRHRISDRFKILQSLVPGGSKMDTVSMLEQAIQYVKFLKNQIWLHQAMIDFVDPPTSISQPSNCAVHPFNNPEFELFEVDRVVADYEQVCLPESWFSGGENWAFDASMQS